MGGGGGRDIYYVEKNIFSILIKVRIIDRIE